MRVPHARVPCPSLESILSFRSLDDRPIERAKRRGEQIMLARNSIEPARGLAKLGKAAFRALEQGLDRGKLLAEPGSGLHRSAQARQRLFLARFGLQPLKLFDGMGQPFAVALRRLAYALALRKAILGFPPSLPGGRNRLSIEPSVCIE